MSLRRRFAAALLGVAVAASLVGCADDSEVVTFTDEHGRVCTALVVDDGSDGDREPTALDCEYPPAGRTPGATTQQPLPGKD
ncbi:MULTISPECIES: hypothetical protein [Polymorphospora]|uniref:Secreted protein n=1 Tax=Polymorphospora lycopeni TaxID=3140240 RepID=A0ABV5CY89_9ACTN